MDTPLPPPVLFTNGNGAPVANGNGAPAANGNGAPANGNGAAVQQAGMIPITLRWTHVAIAGAAIGAFLYFRRK